MWCEAVGLWRLVTAALGNGSRSFKWHRLNLLQPWRAEALSAGSWRGCAPPKAPGEGVSSFFLVCRGRSHSLARGPFLHPQSQQTGIFQSPDSDPPASLSRTP